MMFDAFADLSAAIDTFLDRLMIAVAVVIVLFVVGVVLFLR